MTRGEKLLIKELKREMGSTEPLLEEEIERLNNIINKAIKKCDENADYIEEFEGSYSGLFIEIEDILKESDKDEN